MYTTKEKIENYLLLEIDNDFNDQINEWIESASLFVDQETNRKWIAEEREMLYDGNGKDCMKIDEFTEIDTVEVGNDYLENLEELDFIVIPYNETPKNTILLKDDIFNRGVQNVKITGDFGYAEEVPKDIEFATTVIASGIILAQTNQQGEIASEQIGNYRVQYKDDKHKDDTTQAMNILQNRKLILI